jgi:hypothetical protein
MQAADAQMDRIDAGIEDIHGRNGIGSFHPLVFVPKPLFIMLSILSKPSYISKPSSETPPLKNEDSVGNWDSNTPSSAAFPPVDGTNLPSVSKKLA